MTKEERLKAAEAYVEHRYGWISRQESERFQSHFLAGAEAEAESKWVSVRERNPEPIPENYKKHFLVFLDLCKSYTIGYYHEINGLLTVLLLETLLIGNRYHHHPLTNNKVN